jgi:hypothetical protein
MKAFIFALLFPVVCFAQTTKTPAVKPSTTDCPTWNNKQQVNKTDYYQSLRHPKSAKAQAVVDPNHIAEKKTPVAKPKTEVKKSTVPSFSSGSDPLLEKKKPVEAKTTVKEEAPLTEKKEAAAKPEAKTTAAAKEKTEKKPAKKKDANYNSGKVRTSKKSQEKCPAF